MQRTPRSRCTQTLSPKLKTLCPKLKTLNPKLKNPKPKTLNPELKALKTLNPKLKEVNRCLVVKMLQPRRPPEPESLSLKPKLGDDWV